MNEDVVNKELEEVIKQKAQEASRPEEIAATMYTMYYPRFSKMLDRLSLRQLKRLLRSLVDSNLQTKNYEHKDQYEKEAFIIGDRLLEAKYVMLFTAYTSSLEQLEQAANSEVPVDNKLIDENETVSPELGKENTNG